jgi:peroxiredoxin
MPYMWLNKVLVLLGLGAMAGSVVLVAVAALRGKGKRKRPLLWAGACLAAFVALGAANYALIFLVQLPSLAREAQEARLAYVDAVSLTKPGAEAPSFRITGADGRDFEPNALRGKVLLINFFATWCVPCNLELPHLEELWRQYGGRNDFAMLVIGREESDESLRVFMKQHGYSFPVAADPEHLVYSLYAKELIPRTYVIARDGTISYATTGFKEEDIQRLKTELVSQLRATVVAASPAATGEEDRKDAEDLLGKRFPVLRTPGIPSLVRITDEMLSRTFPEHRFFALIFRQYPVARITPEPLKSQNVFVIQKDGNVQHLTGIKPLEEFFRSKLALVLDAQSARESAGAWLRLSEEFKQDGFFKFSIPQDSLIVQKLKSGLKASGKAVVTQGGSGEIRASLSFTTEGKLAQIEEANTVKAGVRPICQATKLLDPDPIVRLMAEKDLLVMGRAAKEYLDEQRAKASPQLKQAIDRIWQRIVAEGW